MDKTFKKLEYYYNLLYPAQLEVDEYIRIVALKNDGTRHQKFVKSFSEFYSIIQKYKYNWNLYTTISTVKGTSCGKTEDMYRRKILFLDFDKKDFEQYTNLKDFAGHIKDRLSLFYHCVVDSGHGYHFYMATESTTETDKITELNKRVIRVLGADIKAGSPTQLIRIPTSFNFKNPENKLSVNIVGNNYGNDKFRPHTFGKIEQQLRFAETNLEIAQEHQSDPLQQFTENSHKYCIHKMLHEGVGKGERNFCLGRIAKHLQRQGYAYEKAKDTIVGWNQKCRPPKNKDVLLSDFDRYWNTDYNLSGCTIPDPRHQAILAQYCDRYKCESLINGETPILSNGGDLTQKYDMDNNTLKNNVVRKLSGNHYLILSVLHVNKEGLSSKQIQQEITNKSTGKLCMTRKTLAKILDELVIKYNYITCEKKFYKLVEHKNYGAGFTQFSYGASVLLINGVIKPLEYKVYLCLYRNLQKKKNVTHTTLAEDLNISKGNIGDCIKALHEAHAIAVRHVYTEKGVRCNRYIMYV